MVLPLMQIIVFRMSATTKKGCVAFDLVEKGHVTDHIQLSVTGDHNVSNALAAIATAKLLNISMPVIEKGLLSFSGTDRRLI